MACKTLKIYNILDPSIMDEIFVYNAPSLDLKSDKEYDISNCIRELAISSAKSCTYCCTEFSDLQDQRSHYKLDWHRYNLKQALVGRAAVSVEEFSKLADDVSSISGSESELSEDDEEEESEEQIKDENRVLTFRNAKIFWRNKHKLAYSVYRCLLLGRRETASAATLQNSLLQFLKSPKKWLIVMLGGGHFAAAVFEGSSIIVHKTFHCYTVRAKQGQSQASRDAKGGNHAKSAGASLRRYNELALIQHVQDIMKSWHQEIDDCSLILHRAIGPHNKAVLFGGKTPPLSKTDPRLRSIPFATRRATLKEVKRIHDVMSTLQCHGSSDELEKELLFAAGKITSSPQRKGFTQQINEHFGVLKKNSSSKTVDRAKARKPVVREIPGNLTSSSEEVEEYSDLVTNLEEIDLRDLREFGNSFKKKKKKRSNPKRKAKIESDKTNENIKELQKTLLSFCENNDIVQLQEFIASAEASREHNSQEVENNDLEIKTRLKKEDFVEILRGVVSEDSGDTLLHVAAAKSHPAMVTTLLMAGCDPTIRNRRKMVPYVLSGDKATKAAFKDFVALHPEQYDLQKTMIPPPLTEEQEKLLNEKKKEKKKKQKEREKIKKKEEFAKKTDEDERVRFLALSDREKRALAAERRYVQAVTANSFKAVAPALVRCFQCGTDITGKVPFEYSMHLFCTVKCLQAHRNKTKSYGVEI